MTGTREGVVVDFTQVDDMPLHPLGTELNGLDGNTYVYCQADESISAYQICIVRPGSQLLRASAGRTASVPYQIVIPQQALSDTQYGWCVAKGLSFSVLAGASCAADVKLYTSGTIGMVDDTATSQDLIQSLRLNATSAGAQAITACTATSYMRVNAED